MLDVIKDFLSLTGTSAWDIGLSVFVTLMCGGFLIFLTVKAFISIFNIFKIFVLWIKDGAKINIDFHTIWSEAGMYLIVAIFLVGIMVVLYGVVFLVGYIAKLSLGI